MGEDKPVVCIERSEVFSSMKEAMDTLGIRYKAEDVKKVTGGGVVYFGDEGYTKTSKKKKKSAAIRETDTTRHLLAVHEDLTDVVGTEVDSIEELPLPEADRIPVNKTFVTVLSNQSFML
eukprot:g47492.t1